MELSKPHVAGSDVSFRQFYEKTLNDVEKPWAVATAVEALTPPPISDVYEAAHKARIGDGGVEWVGIQWAMFLELSKQRGRAQGTAVPISFHDIRAYENLNRFEFHQLELNNILEMDQVFLEFAGEQIEDMMATTRKK